MSLPRETSASIRRLHHISGHKPPSVMLHLLKGARASKELIRGVRNFRCNDCAEIQEEGHVVKFKMPSTYAFNYNASFDCLSCKDEGGSTYG